MDLDKRQLLPINGSIEAMPNMPFCNLLTNVCSWHAHVPKHMILGRLCNILKTITDLKQLLPTATEDPTLPIAVINFQSDNQITSSPKGAEIQTPGRWSRNINVTGEYRAYRHEFIHMLEPIESMWDRNLSHITAAPTEWNWTRHQIRDDTTSYTGLDREEYISRNKNSITCFRWMLLYHLRTSWHRLFCSPPTRTKVSDLAWLIANTLFLHIKIYNANWKRMNSLTPWETHKISQHRTVRESIGNRSIQEWLRKEPPSLCTTAYTSSLGCRLVWKLPQKPFNVLWISFYQA